MSLSDFQWRIDDLVRDKDQVISSSQRDQALQDAVMRYSLDFARPVMVNVVAPGGHFVPTPAGWVSGYSQVLLVEYPAGQSPLSEIPLNEMGVRYSPGDVEVLEFAYRDFIAGQTIALRYTQRHVVDSNTDTIPEHHRYPVCCWAASILCGELANWYATEGASTLGADTADHVGKTERLRARARDLAMQFMKDLGINEKRPNIAGVVVETPRLNTQGRPTLFRNRRGDRWN
jgi:hypothetical protein